jgi:precorrin-6Y C5,15-methyltransferase (decarboxylating)
VPPKINTLKVMSFDPPSTAAVWLSIVGLPAGDLASFPLPAAARAAIEAAELVVGSRRQLDLVRDLVRDEAKVMTWPSPLADGVANVLARRGRRTCVLASGDPFFYGIGATLAPHLERSEFVCHPAPSSVSLAAARLGWPLQDTELVSLHGRELSGVIPYLQPGRRVLALSWDRRTPGELASLLTARGFGSSQLLVLEDLGSVTERVRGCRACDFDLAEVADLNLIGLQLTAADDAQVMPVRGSLPDAAFEHDGQLTKQDIRALTLSALAPFAGARLWDVGAGAGSIAIEWMLAHPACRAIAIEARAERAERIGRNATALGVPGLKVVQARAPEALADLPAPDAVFIGGGASESGVFGACWSALRRGGRLVVNAVTLESQAQLFAWYAAHGGELCRLSIEHAVPLGSLTSWRPAMPITQWRVRKP